MEENKPHTVKIRIHLWVCMCHSTNCAADNFLPSANTLLQKIIFTQTFFWKYWKLFVQLINTQLDFFLFVCVNVLHSRMNFKWKGKKCTEFEMTHFSKWYRWKQSKCLIKIYFFFGISSSLCFITLRLRKIIQKVFSLVLPMISSFNRTLEYHSTSN